MRVFQIGESATKVRETSKLGGTPLISLFPVEVFTWFNCKLVTTQNISIRGVLQIRESANEIWENLKLGGIWFIWVFRIGLFTWFNCGLVKTQDMSIAGVPQVGEVTSGIGETSKHGGIRFIWHMIGPSWGVYLIQLWTGFDSRHFDCEGATNWRIFECWNMI